MYPIKHEQNRGRREFLILSTTAPLVILTTPSEAFIPALLIRFFARRVISYFIKKGVKKIIRNVVVKNAKKKGRARVAVNRAIQIHSKIDDLLEAHQFLSNQVWSRYKNNYSTLVLTNNSNRAIKTDNITLKMKDEENENTEFKAKVKPVKIPPKSTVVVDLKVQKIKKTGIKRLHASSKDEYSTSGNVLVVNNRRGLTIEELYREYYKRHNRNNINHSQRLDDNIIL